MKADTIDWINTYPNFLECSIQTFNDQNKEEKSQSRILEVNYENLEKCEILQDKLPYGIYFSVNPMEKWKRNRDSVKFIQTWICDIDSWTKEEQLELIKKAPLQPSLVVESVHGFHLYYLADKHLTDEEYENGNRWLKNYYNWDPKVCKDTARVLRIPWYYHMKNIPVLVEFRKDLSSKDKYSVEQITKAFPNQTDTTPGRVKQREAYNRQLNDNDSFRAKAWDLNSRQMLEELSWTWWLGWDVITFKRNSNWTEQIYCNGKSTGCWIDNRDMIGSSDKWWPTWIQWLKRYWVVNWWDLAKELKKKHPELEEKKVEKLDTTKLIYNSTVIPKLERPSFTWWDKALDNEMWKLSKWQLIILCWETWAWKTTFATFMARKNKNCCYYVLEDKVENIAMRYAMKYAGITKEEYNEWSRWEDKQKLYEEWYIRFVNRDLEMVDIWHKITIDSLIDSMSQMVEAGKEMFFIDNLGFIVGNWDNEATQTADASNKLVSFCLEKKVCIVLLHHFKKKGKASDVRDIWQMRWSWKLGDDSFMVVEYIRDEDQTFLRVYKDRTWWDIALYEIWYNRWDFIFLNKDWVW